MPTDCSVRCTPTILPNIRISWDYHPTFMLISGRSQGLSSTYEQAHVDLDLLTLTSYDVGVKKRPHTVLVYGLFYLSGRRLPLLLFVLFLNQICLHQVAVILTGRMAG